MEREDFFSTGMRNRGTEERMREEEGRREYTVKLHYITRNLLLKIKNSSQSMMTIFHFIIFFKTQFPLHLFHGDHHSSVPRLFLIFRSIPFAVPAHENRKHGSIFDRYYHYNTNTFRQLRLIHLYFTIILHFLHSVYI
jgi:hypothetical protein